MEENNEYGNCWQDLEKRIDMENRVADATIRAWQMEEENEIEEEEVLSSSNRKKRKTINDGGMQVGGKRARKEEGKERRGRAKEKTGGEMHREITERNEQRGVQKRQKWRPKNWLRREK
jgi:hypothetical protein